MPSVASSQSMMPITRGSVLWKIMLSRRKSPWTIRVSSLSAGMWAGSHSARRSIAAFSRVFEAVHCFDQRSIWRWK